MHYVTEDQLREAYAKKPFQSYEVPSDARLTPSARQFLIDFRIDFDSGDEVGHIAALGHAETKNEKAHKQAINQLVEDARLLGAKLRLLARRSLGIDNHIARAADDLGSRWQGANSVNDFAGDGSNKYAEPHSPKPAPMPPMDVMVHPIYFEMAELHAEIGACARRWLAVRKDVEPSQKPALDAWLTEASGMCDEFEAAINKAGEAD